ncbi:hypothetical protein [Allosphingosinicella flava]|nr:hypothetical protein [Sphingosinicella flava]
MSAVNAGRRQEARSAVLIAAQRAAANPPSAEMLAKVSGAWSEALKIFRDFASLLTPAAIRELDELVAQVDDPTEPAADILRAALVSGMGFSEAEYMWELDELEKAGYRPLALLSEGDPAILKSLVLATASGASGIRPIGFATMSSSAEANEHVAAAVCRARAAGLTASLFHLLPAMVLLAAHQAPKDSALYRLRRKAEEKRALFH